MLRRGDPLQGGYEANRIGCTNKRWLAKGLLVVKCREAAT